jgi:O-acetylhomoserine/O-acetylserine sulfhydrylase-like pyridoxal-dependent enzyme
LAHTLPQHGHQHPLRRPCDIAALEALIDERTKAVFCESIGNPPATSPTSPPWPPPPTATACR